jgi:TatD DNase family protein
VIDFHCHLDLYKDPASVIQRAVQQGVYVLSVTTTPKAWPGTARLAKGHPRIQTALGLHPQVAHERADELSLFEMILPEARYVGEIGLDGSRDHLPFMPAQQRVFRHILQCTARVGGRIMTLHSRLAASSVLEELRRHSDAGAPVLHWFTGTSDELVEAIDMGCWFSVGPAMLKSKAGRERALAIPRDRMLTETDGPFGELSGKALEPIHVSHALVELGKLWSQTAGDVAGQIDRNLKHLLQSSGMRQP